MIKLQEILTNNSNQYYKLITIFGDFFEYEEKKGIIIKKLLEMGWKSYNIEDVTEGIVEKLPENKIKLRITEQLKNWFLDINEKVILDNTGILYSPELGLSGAFNAFKYLTREKESILFLEGVETRENKIAYSFPGKPDYCESELSEVIAVNIKDIEI